MKLTRLCLLLCISISFYPPQDIVLQLAVARMQYIYLAKQTAGDSMWPSFGNDRYNIPLLYYSNNTTFVSNPHQKFQVFLHNGVQRIKAT